MNTTVLSSCALVGLRHQADALGTPPLLPHPATLRDEGWSLIVPTLYDPPDFAALCHADKDRAITLVAAMTEPQRVRQALAYAAWLEYYGLAIDLDTVLAAWEQR